jgi:hypothetical protein
MDRQLGRSSEAGRPHRRGRRLDFATGHGTGLVDEVRTWAPDDAGSRRCSSPDVFWK